MNNQVYNKIKQKGIGPGGLYCPCCTDYNPTEQKRFDKRKARRYIKNMTRREVNEQNQEETA